MKRESALRRLSLAAASVIAIMAGSNQSFAQQAAPAAQAPLTRFDISAQPLASALMEFGRQARTTVVAPSELVRGRRSSAVAGEMTAEAALTQLLAGAGLRLERTTEGGLGVVADAASPTQPGASQSAPSDADNETIVVTGTNIRGLRNPTAPTQSFTREDIDNTGYATTQDFVRSLPQNFQGGSSGASEDGRLGSGVSARTNQEAASGVNLRGLGASSTLVLLNGRRMAPAAFGGIVDISVIPLAAIDRIDVVTDGSSAIYGGDAVAGVVNFILRRDFEGSETRLAYGGVTDGSMRTTIASQTLGANWESGGLVATAQYQDRTPLLTAERDFTALTPQITDINPHTTKYSFLFAGRQQLSPRLELFGDALVSLQDLLRRARQSATAAQVIDNTSLQQSYNLGFGYDAFADWRFELRGSYGQQRTAFSYDFVQPVPAGYAVGATSQENTAEVTAFELNADGSLFDLPGGRMRAALGAGWREEAFLSDTLYLPVTSPVRLRAAERDVNSAYGELYVPIVGEANAFASMRRLDLSLAARWDAYSDFGETTNPKVGLIWSPFEGLDLRGSWSTSFRAPIANELMNLGTAVTNFQLPAPGGGAARVFVIGGTDPDLGPEESESYTLGFDYRPLEGLLISLNYYDIHFTDRLLLPGLVTSILSQPATYGSIVTPLADDAAAAAFLADLVANGAIFQNTFGYGSTGVRYAVNLQMQNASGLDQSGYDFSALYNFEAGDHRFYAELSGSVINEIVTRLTETSTPADIVDTYANPVSLRLRTMLGWSRGGWRANAAVNYRGAYDDTSASPVGEVDPWTTADFNVGYAFGQDGGAGSVHNGVSLELNVSNVFDEPPPYVVGVGAFQPGLHYDVANADPYGRIVSFEIRKRW